MLNARVIPCLLLRNRGLVKTVGFKDAKYIGDPVNAVKIFNDKEVDELFFLDIDASANGKPPPLKELAAIAGECFMPLGYGGGIRNIEDLHAIFAIGVEKACINSQAIENPGFVERAAKIFGSQSIVVSIDVRKNLFGKYEVFGRGGRQNAKMDPVEHAQRMYRSGAGEIFINSIDRDGTMQGYDIEIIRRVAESVRVPVVACGGAGSLEHFRQALDEGGASAVSAGSMFVFHGKHRAVLISYPSQAELKEALGYATDVAVAERQ